MSGDRQRISSDQAQVLPPRPPILEAARSARSVSEASRPSLRPGGTSDVRDARVLELYSPTSDLTRRHPKTRRYVDLIPQMPSCVRGTAPWAIENASGQAAGLVGSCGAADSVRAWR
jgi:hypothetical protein